MFVDQLKDTLNDEFNVAVTENGAIGYATTGEELLDMNFAVTSMRKMSEQQIEDRFAKVFYEDKIHALKWMFYARDIRGGLGERRLFRICMKYLAENHQQNVKSLIPLVAEYGRWDDILCLLNTDLQRDVTETIKKQLDIDIANMRAKKPISLLAKWLPSAGASSAEKKYQAELIADAIGMSIKGYRKTLSELRAYLRIVERYMSQNRWSEIEYSAVPSRANIFYNSVFLKHDEERRRRYLESLQRGETKINSSTCFPHDIVSMYTKNGVDPYRSKQLTEDITLEEMWKSLPDYVNGAENTICVSDGSGSMTKLVGNSKTVTALDVANALSIYFSERSSGEFKNKYITFSRSPQLVDLSTGKSLKEKIEIARRYNEISNTNIEAVFNLILTTAVKGHMRQEEIPHNILILSDMEFDECAVRTGERLFQQIAGKYARHGYNLPRLVFWNICSRTMTIPVKQNELGVALVSGFSPSVANMVLSSKLDPLECLLEQLNSERYKPVEDAVRSVISLRK